MRMRSFAFLFFVLFACGILCLFAARSDIVLQVNGIPRPVIILDAGHGGEDGGAVAPDGTPEKDINLSVSEIIAMYFDWFGVDYVMVREKDELIGDNSLPTVRERKVSDIRKRMSLVKQTPGAVLLSIHQNIFISSRYSGTQVFYAKNAPGSMELAETIQRAVVSALQPDNERKVKPTEGTVFLLDEATKTSVMVECGFLSNERELSKLKTPEYRSQISLFIALGVCEYINN